MNRSSGQLQRRINEKVPKVYEMDGQKPSSSNVGHYPFSNRPGEINTEAGNIISLHGSSSNSDSTHENEVIQPSYIRYINFLLNFY
ncbi:hypothetical protein AQUCO_08400003v1 [Aquilegia coerulea]|uniref:Uncharacterized protein n=1 Tax=Aquilegia coerulea TaxID=218851 RepID=A0A2G5C6N6_AQUCA|nr:hypothetical protein AQUCO_08400003v1 [Aquilegia coerulea]